MNVSVNDLVSFRESGRFAAVDTLLSCEWRRNFLPLHCHKVSPPLDEVEEAILAEWRKEKQPPIQSENACLLGELWHFHRKNCDLFFQCS